jgi:hypothetical protein
MPESLIAQYDPAITHYLYAQSEHTAPTHKPNFEIIKSSQGMIVERVATSTRLQESQEILSEHDYTKS